MNIKCMYYLYNNDTLRDRLNFLFYFYFEFNSIYFLFDFDTLEDVVKKCGYLSTYK